MGIELVPFFVFMESFVTYASILAAAGFAFWGWSCSIELREYQAAALEAQSQAIVDAFQTEGRLKDNAAQIQSEDGDQITRIEHLASIYISQLDSLQHDSSSGGANVPYLTSSTRKSGSAKGSQSPPESSGICPANLEKTRQSLVKAKQRLLYEAKEYDILATHYNSLLRLYNESKEMLDHAKAEDRSYSKDAQENRGTFGSRGK